MSPTDATPEASRSLIAASGVARPGFVYCCYSVDGQLVYIGSTTNINQRVHVHERQTPFADRFAVVSYLVMPLADARAEEVAAIAAERPPLNRTHNPDYEGLYHQDAMRLFAERLASVPRSPCRPHIVDGRSHAERAEDEERMHEVLRRMDRFLIPPTAA